MPGSKSANLAPKEIAKCDNLPEFVTIGCVEVATPEIKDAIHPEIDHYLYIYIYICAGIWGSLKTCGHAHATPATQPRSATATMGPLASPSSPTRIAGSPLESLPGIDLWPF